jgi:hypothetical protein
MNTTSDSNCTCLRRDNVPFILPRTLSSKDTLKGVASILISIKKPDSSDAQPPHEFPPEDVSIDYDFVSTTAESTSSSTDLPYAHVIRGRGRRFCAVLPIICVADEYNIIEVVTSVAYQRLVWGIDEPVVGMCLSEHGTVGRLVLGWYDSQPVEWRVSGTCQFCIQRDIRWLGDWTSPMCMSHLHRMDWNHRPLLGYLI